MIEGVFLRNFPNAFFELVKAKKKSNTPICVESGETARRAPQAISSRRVLSRGRGIVLGRLDTAFRDPFFAFMCLAEGHRDASGLFIWGGGAFSAPSGLFSHALVPAPRFFFFLFLFFLLALGAPNGLPDAIVERLRTNSLHPQDEF